MQANGVFLIMAALASLGVLAIVLAPLLRGAGRAERRASYDMQVYRDQLRTIEADVARGALGTGEAAAIRLEISRRLLAAADAETAEAAPQAAPRRVSLAAGGLLGLAALALALGLYDRLGVPGLPDAPLDARLRDLAEARAQRPGQVEAEALAAAQAPAEAPASPSSGDMILIERLRAAVTERPDDLQGQKLLARSEAALGRWAAARAAQQKAVDLMGDAAQPSDRVDLAEFMILATRGYVSPEAEGLLSQALAAAPGDPAARYYSGLALLQGGRPDLAHDLWSRLLEEGPEDAPWIAPIRAQIANVAALAGRPAPETGGPSAAEVEAAQGMSEADRSEMISGMVAQLSDRLAAEGGPPEDWAQLIRSLAVLGRMDEARSIWRESRDVFAADPAALGLLRDAAASAGVTE
jgi:cytochrome c-type biogenesis protein CcmH